MKRGEPTVYTFRQAPPAGLQPVVTYGFTNYPRILHSSLPPNHGYHTETPAMYIVTLKVYR